MLILTFNKERPPREAFQDLLLLMAGEATTPRILENSIPEVTGGSSILCGNVYPLNQSTTVWIPQRLRDSPRSVRIPKLSGA